MIFHFTGNGAYCYAHSLHMFLRASHSAVVPEPGFLECLTLMPFGKCFSQGLFFPNPPGLDPDLGVTQAIQTLGGTTQEVYGGSADEAFECLKRAVNQSPVLVGPLDLGYLTYIPGHKHLRGSDHYACVLQVKDKGVILHDPAGYPYAHVAKNDFLQSWQAKDIIYGRKPYMMRFGFQQVKHVRREEQIVRTLSALATRFGEEGFQRSITALKELALTLRDEITPRLANHLLHFALPTAVRRLTDAAEFMLEAGEPKIAEWITCQAILFSETMQSAISSQWDQVAAIVDRVISIEEELPLHFSKYNQANNFN